ncbi:MAG: winged helix DNA-binding domain-containing protein [Draconibacterium sp.]
MDFSEISNIRLASQHLTERKYTSLKEIADYMGAMQAQDYPMVKWAIGQRLSCISDKQVDSAINSAEIIRTHVLRPTWHIISPDDIYWMLDLTAPHIKSSTQSRHKELKLNEKNLSKIFKLIEKTLRDKNHLTREELYSIFHQAKIYTNDNRGAHILMSAELAGIICSGQIKNKKQTFALLNERVVRKKYLTRDEAIEKLARKYFTSHAPATLNDFIWWSGLPVKDARKSFEMLENEFVQETINDTIYLIPNSLLSTPKMNSVLLLPAYDEFLISYTNRSASIVFEDQKKTISNNGIFRPTIAINGKISGIWKRTTKKDKVVIEIEPFKKLNKTQIQSIEKEVERLEVFWDKQTVLKF